MAADTLNERRGYVKKSSGFGGTLALALGIGVVVAGAGVAGLQYAMSHGWDQPNTSGQIAPEPPTTSINLEHLETVETTSATLPIVVTDPAASDTAAPADAPPTPKTKPTYNAHAKPKSDNAAPSTGDPFTTNQ